MTFATLFLALCAAVATAAPLYDHAWAADTSEPRTEVITIGQGEAVTLKASFSTDGVPLELPTGTVCTLYWQTQSMSNLWWSAPGTVSGHALVAEWSPTNDVGEARYNVFLAADKSGDKIYQAAALIKMRTTPGHTPNTLPLPVQVLDFAQLQVLNPPWPTDAVQRTEFNSATNALETATAAKLAGYLPLSGGTMSGPLNADHIDSGDIDVAGNLTVGGSIDASTSAMAVNYIAVSDAVRIFGDGLEISAAHYTRYGDGVILRQVLGQDGPHAVTIPAKDGTLVVVPDPVGGTHTETWTFTTTNGVTISKVVIVGGAE